MTGRPEDWPTAFFDYTLFFYCLYFQLRIENRQPKTVLYYTIEKTIFLHYHGKSAEAFRHPDSNP